MAYKWQHWLPVAYLRGFSSDQTKKNRNSKVYRFDGKSSLVKAEKECAANFTYSQIRGQEAEESFHEFENKLPMIVEKIEKGDLLSSDDKYDMICILFDLHLRNEVFKVKTDQERFDEYLRAVKSFRSQELADLPRMADPSKIQQGIIKNWDLSVIECRDRSEGFYTSDNPVILLGDGQKQLTAAVLPVGPFHAVVVTRSDQVKVNTTEVSESSVGALNRLQTKISGGMIYTHRELPPEEQSSAAASLKEMVSRGNQPEFDISHMRDCYLPLDDTMLNKIKFLEIV